jgi:hypothetical protein
MIFHAMSVIGMEPFEHVPSEHFDHALLVLGRYDVDGTNSGACKRAAKKFHPGHVFDNHVAGIDGAPCHLREAISAGDRMIYNFEFT